MYGRYDRLMWIAGMYNKMCSPTSVKMYTTIFDFIKSNVQIHMETFIQSYTQIPNIFHTVLQIFIKIMSNVISLKAGCLKRNICLQVAMLAEVR